jgi:pyridoxamine 5'-phosphate oxidase family protein
MSTFTELELEYLAAQRLARLATASISGQPDVAVVGFALEGDAIVSGGFDLTKTIRLGNLRENPRATILIDDLASISPWTPRGVKVRGKASVEDHERALRIRIEAEVIWSWGINLDAEKRFASIERRSVDRS